MKQEGIIRGLASGSPECFPVVKIGSVCLLHLQSFGLDLSNLMAVPATELTERNLLVHLWVLPMTDGPGWLCVVLEGFCYLCSPVKSPKEFTRLALNWPIVVGELNRIEAHHSDKLWGYMTHSELSLAALQPPEWTCNLFLSPQWGK